MNSITTNVKIKLILFINLASFFSFSQPWLEAPFFSPNRGDSLVKRNVNFFEIQKAFQEYEKAHTEIVNGEFKKIAGFKTFKRWEYFMEPRVYPSGDLTLPTKMMGQYLEEFKKFKNDNKSLTGKWIPLGPYNSTLDGNQGGLGRVAAIRFDPLNSNIMWACSPLGGLWKSTDGGANWQNSNTDFNAQIGCTDVAISPTNNNVMYLATGDADGNGSALGVSSQGVLKSIDGGKTWGKTALSWENNLNLLVYRVIVHPTNPLIAIAATTQGILRTNDGGVTWPIITGTAPYDFTDIEFNVTDPNIIYATSKIAGTFHRSIDNGITWTTIKNGLPSDNTLRRGAIAISPKDSKKVYYLISNSSNKFYGLYVSNDSGVSFKLRSSYVLNSPSGTPDILSLSTNSQAWYDMALAVSPVDTSKVLIGGIQLYKSINGGINWSICGYAQGVPFAHADHHDVQFLPGSNTTYFDVNDGGITKTINDASTWTTIDKGMQTSQAYGLGISKLDPNHIILGLQDNGYPTLQTNNWWLISNAGGDGMDAIFDRHTDNIIYFNSYQGRIFRTSNHGGSSPSWITVTGSGVNSLGSWHTPFVQHPNLDSTFLVGKSQVYKTTDAGTSWSQLGSVSGGGTYLIGLAIATSNPNYIYAVKTNKFFACINGTSFIDRTGNLPVASAQITAVTTSNTDPNRVWVTFSGYSSGNKVFTSLDAGVTWLNNSDGLPNLPVNSITFHNNSSNGVYVGTDAGVYFRSDSLSSWIPFSTNLPNVDVSELEITYSINKLRAATNGRGLWESDLAIPTSDFSFSTACQNDPVTFTDNSIGDPTKWKWVFEGGSPATSNDKNPNVTFDTPGIHKITLNSGNENGTTERSYLVDVTKCSTANTILKNQLSQIKVYPNQTTNDIHIYGEDILNGTYQIVLTNEIGQLVYKETIEVNNHKILKTLTRTLSEGKYFLTISSDSVKNVTKIIVKK